MSDVSADFSISISLGGAGGGPPAAPSRPALRPPAGGRLPAATKGPGGSLRPLGPDHPNGLAQFSVEVDGLDLGTFTGCEGLAAEYSMEDVMEGGENGYVYKLPGRVKYPTVKLTRLLTAESAKLSYWFSNFEKRGTQRKLAIVTLFSGVLGSPDSPQVICTWLLKDVHPVKWTGPSFAADGNGVAKETLELAYHGFDWTPKQGG